MQTCMNFWINALESDLCFCIKGYTLEISCYPRRHGAIFKVGLISLLGVRASIYMTTTQIYRSGHFSDIDRSLPGDLWKFFFFFGGGVHMDPKLRSAVGMTHDLRSDL